MRSRNCVFSLNEHCISKIIRQVMAVKVKCTIVNLKLSHYVTVHLHKSYVASRPWRIWIFFWKFYCNTQKPQGPVKSHKHAFHWSAGHCSSQHRYISLLSMHRFAKFSQRRSNGFVGIHIYKNRDSLAFTCNVLTAQVVSENGRWQWQRFIAVLPVSQSGVIISWLMVKWCSSCQEHTENGCLVSTMFLQHSNDAR